MFVIGTTQLGGTEQHLLLVSSALARRGWQVSLCSLAGDGPLRRDFEDRGVPVYRPPVDRSDKMNIATRLVKLAIASGHLLYIFIARRPKIVHFFLPRAYLTGAPLAVLARLPIRVMSRRSLNRYQKSHPVLQSVERWWHKTMTAVLGNSMSVVEELLGEGVSETKLGVIYNGIDLKRFTQLKPKAELRVTLGIPPQALVFIIVANLIPYKGHFDLLDAFASAAARMPPDWHLLVVGRDDGIGQALRARAALLGIAKHLSFLGSRRDVPELLGASDVGLLCSHEEGFSNAIIEAMSCGLPMIVTQVGGNAEAVIDGVTGYVVPPRDPAAFAGAIERLSHDAALRARFGEAGRIRAVAEYSLDRCVERYEALYRALLEGRRPQDVPEVAVTA